MIKIKYIFWAFIIYYSISCIAQDVIVHGIVYADLNHNGQQEENEPGIPNVMVSNQKDVVLTNEQGKYELHVQEDCSIMITKPEDYDLPLSLPYHLPKFAHLYTKDAAKKFDFPLIPAKVKNNFKIVVIADPQVHSMAQVNYLRQDFVEPIMPHHFLFGIALGDLGYQANNMWHEYNSLMSQIPFPWFNVLGNHDVNYEEPTDEKSDKTFRKDVGANYYSFNYGQVHFIVLDSVFSFMRPKATKSIYKGLLTEKQLTWIKNDLSFVPKNKLIVFCSHIPLNTYTAEAYKANPKKYSLDKIKCSFIHNRNAFFDIVKDRKNILFLAGHTHGQKQDFLGKKHGFQDKNKIHHMICTTLSGGHWSGSLDERGVATAMQYDGIPNGYYVFNFKKNTYIYTFHAASKPSSYQMEIHCPNGTMTQKQCKESQILVNIFEHSPKTKTYYSIDHQEFKLMENIIAKDPKAEWFYELNPKRHKVLKAKKIRNIWVAPFPNLELGIHSITIKTVDMYKRVFQSSRVFFIQKGKK